jgi:crotonobetainyl-CoA:carnitine CoA-transferase CaiB-like acyl-CoA transferase
MTIQDFEGPLRGLRVIDLSAGITGAYATKLLADAGADVVKLEPPEGDPLRRWTASGQALAKDQDGALFQFLNTSKRGAVADLSTDAGRSLAVDLTARADVVFESWGPGGAAARGLDWETLHEASPHTTWVSISPWGGEGPWADRPSTEFTLQAATGSTAFRGLPALGPVAAGGRLGEWIPGVYAALGGMFGWLSARRTGAGHHVDVSMFEALCLSMTIYHDLNSQLFEGPLMQAIETPSIEPARDGWVGLCTITGQQWKDFCALIGRSEVGEDKRYLDARNRMEDLEFIHEIIHAYTREHTVAEICEVAQLLRIPANPLGDGRTLPEMEQFVARGTFVENPAGFLQPRPPYRLHGLHGGAAPVLRPAPRLGEHAEEVAAERSAARESASPRGGDAYPLAGLRVLDLTAFWAGPIATSVFGEMGADVIKVESIQRPDGMRFAGSVMNDTMWEYNPINHGCNSSKRGVTLRLDSDEGLALVKRLVEKADIVAENFSARVLENFGLGWKTIRELNPRAILLRMPSFGLDGPWRDNVGFAMNVEQVSGLAWMTGYPQMPLVVRGACDPVGGMHAVFAALLALEERERTGEGQLVEVPLVEPAINLAAEQVVEWSAYGAFLERETNRGPLAAPQGCYPCGDRAATGQGAAYVALACETDAQWQALREVLGDPAVLAPAALDQAAGRRQAHDEIDETIVRWTSARTAGAAEEALLAAGVPASVVINAHDLSPNPQLEHRGFFQQQEHPLAGSLRYPGQPQAYSGFPRGMRRRLPPMLGEHNEEVLRGELGLTGEEIEQLRDEQVIGDRPSFM